MRMLHFLWQLMFTSAALAGLPAAIDQPAQRPEAVHSGQSPDVDAARPRNPRVLFIAAKECPRCEQALARLSRPGGDFDKLRAAGWKIGASATSHLQIVDRDTIPQVVERLGVREFPTVACVNDGQIVRSFKSGCTTPLDRWTIGFLAKGIDERPPGAIPEAASVETTGHYPLRGNHWSVDDDWNPTKEKVVGHLRGPNHGHQILKNWEIETWSYEELRSLHDNLHEREMGGATYSGRSQQVNQFSATRKVGGH